MLHRWLDCWRGIGQIVTGMERQAWDVSLTRYPQGWRCTFIRRDYTTRPWVGQVLSFHPTPWRAVQHAALSVLTIDRRCCIVSSMPLLPWAPEPASPLQRSVVLRRQARGLRVQSRYLRAQSRKLMDRLTDGRDSAGLAAARRAVQCSMDVRWAAGLPLFPDIYQGPPAQPSRCPEANGLDR